MNPVIGQISCPMCDAVGRDTIATVHREKRGKHALYFRCCECGTLQPRLEGGQEAMKQLLKPVVPGAPNPEQLELPLEELGKASGTKAKSKLGKALKNLLTEE